MKSVNIFATLFNMYTFFIQALLAATLTFQNKVFCLKLTIDKARCGNEAEIFRLISADMR